MRTLVAVAGLALSLVLVGSSTAPSPAAPRIDPDPTTTRSTPSSTASSTTRARALATGWRKAAATATGTPAIWAIDYTTAQIVRFSPTSDGAVTRTVLAQVGYAFHLEVDPAGNVYVLDLQAGLLLRITPGGARTVVRAMTPYRSNFALDHRGNVFLYDVDHDAVQRVVRIDAATGKHTLLGTVTLAQSITADDFGHAIVAVSDRTGPYDNSALAVFPAAGGTPTIRPLNTGPVYQLRATPYGDVLFNVDPQSAAGANILLRWDHVSHQVSDPTTSTSLYAWNLDPSGRLFVMQEKSWCPAPSRADGCKPAYDPSVDTVLVYPAGGGRYHRDVPVSGLSQIPSWLTADGHGVMAVAGAESDPALRVLLPWGGPAYTVATGVYFSPVARS